ncbi:MAG TPA: DUF3187 family protein [Thermoanaerobaculia bacterium]|nr:DUF3187 family protein [Thermoanaerobaculia bacterium]
MAENSFRSAFHQAARGLAGVLALGALLLAVPAARAQGQSPTPATPPATASASSDVASTALEIPGSPQAGPIGVSAHFLLSEGYLVAVPTGTAVLPANGTAIEVQQGFINTFSLSDSLLPLVDDPKRGHRITPEEIVAGAPAGGRKLDYLVDGEVARTEITARRGIGYGVELVAVLPVLHVGGGFLDGFIEGFHKTFDIKRSDRFAAQRDRYLVYLRSGDRRVVHEVEPGWGLGDLVLGAKVALPAKPAGFDLAAQGLLKLPTGDRDKLFSSGSADLGVELLGSRPFTRARLYFTLGAVREGRWQDLGAQAATVLSASAAYEHRFFRRSAAVVELAVSDSPLKGFGNAQLAEKTYILTLGWKQALAPTRSVYFAFNENLFNYDGTPDFGFFLGFVQRLGT